MGLVVRLRFLQATLLLILRVDTLDIVAGVVTGHPFILDLLVGEKLAVYSLIFFKLTAQFLFECIADLPLGQCRRDFRVKHVFQRLGQVIISNLFIDLIKVNISVDLVLTCIIKRLLEVLVEDLVYKPHHLGILGIEKPLETTALQRFLDE